MAILLVGIIHSDYYGTRRLKNALEKEKPAIITIESCASHSLEKYQNSVLERFTEILMQKGLSKKLIKEYVNFNKVSLAFEEKGCSNYADEHHIPIHFVDENLSRHQYLKNIELEFEMALEKYSNLEKKVLEKIIKKRIDNTIDQYKKDDIYRVASSVFKSHACLPEALEEIYIGLREKGVYGRDELMAKRIRKIAGENLDANILHVGGLGHLFDDNEGKTLYSKLKEEFNPKRTTLLDYD